jgi:hypothetical protein
MGQELDKPPKAADDESDESEDVVFEERSPTLGGGLGVRPMYFGDGGTVTEEA